MYWESVSNTKPSCYFLLTACKTGGSIVASEVDTSTRMVAKGLEWAAM